MRFIKNIKFFIALVASILMVACGFDKLVDEVIEDVERGAVLRTISLTGGSWNVVDDTETFSIEWEQQDIEDGDLLQEVRVYGDLVDNTAGGTTDPAEVLLATIPASEFESGVNGLPRTNYSITLAEISSALGISLGEYNCGDEFNLRIEMDLTDGRTITANDLSGTVSGGSFFSSPLNYRIGLIFLLPSETVYTGDYNITFSDGAFGAGSPDYTDGVYTIEAIDNVTRVIRSVGTLPWAGGFGPEDITFSFVCDQIIFGSNNDLGAGCGAAIVGGPAEVNTTFDVANPDDSAFQINYTSAVDDGGCGVTPTPATITLTKI